jgi:hypothetical protein
VVTYIEELRVELRTAHCNRRIEITSITSCVAFRGSTENSVKEGAAYSGDSQACARVDVKLSWSPRYGLPDRKPERIVRSASRGRR